MAIASPPAQPNLSTKFRAYLAETGVTGDRAEALARKFDLYLAEREKQANTIPEDGSGYPRGVGNPSVPAPQRESADPAYARFLIPQNDPTTRNTLMPRQTAASPEEIRAGGMKFSAPLTQPVNDRGMLSSGFTSFKHGLADFGDTGPILSMLSVDNEVTPDVANAFAQSVATQRSRSISEGSAGFNRAVQGGAGSLLSYAASEPMNFLQGAIDQNLQSLGGTAASMAAAPLAGSMAPALMGAGSGLAEARSELVSALEDAGVDPTDGTAVAIAMNTPGLRDKIRSRVLRKSYIVGTADAATMGLSSRIPGGKTFVGKMASQAAETGVEALGGMTGEALSQAGSGQKLDSGNILAEGIGEILPGSAQLASLAVRRALAGGITPGGFGTVPPQTPPTDRMGGRGPTQTRTPQTPDNRAQAPDTPVDTPVDTPQTPPNTTALDEAAALAEQRLNDRYRTQPSAPIPSGSTFTTEKGSTYTFHEDGTTTRNKAARPDHPGESGPQPRSARTWFVRPEDLSKLDMVQATTVYPVTLDQHEDGRIGVRALGGPDAGKFYRGSMVTPQKTPAVGLIPVESWGDKHTVHFGNPIVSVASRAAPVGSPSPADQSASSQTEQGAGADVATASVLRDLGIDPAAFSARVEQARVEQYRSNPQQAYLDGKITREQLVAFLEERVANDPGEQLRRQAETRATGPQLPMRRVDTNPRPAVTVNPNAQQQTAQQRRVSDRLDIEGKARKITEAVGKGWILDRRFGLMDTRQQEDMIRAGERLDPIWGETIRPEADPATLERLGIARAPQTQPAPSQVPQGRAGTLADLLGMDSEADAQRYANTLSPSERERLGLPQRAPNAATPSTPTSERPASGPQAGGRTATGTAPGAGTSPSPVLPGAQSPASSGPTASQKGPVVGGSTSASSQSTSLTVPQRAPEVQRQGQQPTSQEQPVAPAGRSSQPNSGNPETSRDRSQPLPPQSSRPSGGMPSPVAPDSTSAPSTAQGSNQQVPSPSPQYTREPWQMTVGEWAMQQRKGAAKGKEHTTKRLTEREMQEHERIVTAARDAGKTIPPEVLAQYPDLLADPGKMPNPSESPNSSNPPAKPDSSTQPQGKASSDRYWPAFERDGTGFVVEDTSTGEVVSRHRTSDEADAAAKRLNEKESQPQGQAAATTNKERTNGEEEAPQAEVLNTGTAAPAPAQGTGAVGAKPKPGDSAKSERQAEIDAIAPDSDLDATGTTTTIADIVNNIREGKRRYVTARDSQNKRLGASMLESVRESVVSGMERLRDERARWEGRAASQPAPAKVEGKKGAEQLTADGFRQKIASVAKSQEQADAIIGLVEARAKVAGESLDQYVSKRIADVRKSDAAPADALEQAVENLVVVHNLSDRNIRFTNELGGSLAMPSVAISNIDAPITGFGEISLIAPKSLIDPKASRSNRVYDADVYSPRYPSATHKFSSKPPIWEKIEKWVSATYGDMKSVGLKKEDRDIRSALWGMSGHFESGEFSNRGIDELERDTLLMAYFADTVLGRKFRGTEDDSVRVKLQTLVRDKKMKEFRAWIGEHFAPYVTRKLFKGHTYSGTPRYADYTIDNVMREMRKQQREEGGEGGFYGAGSVRARVAKRFKSIKEIQKDRGRLIPREQLEKSKKDFNARLSDIAEKGRAAFDASASDFGFTERFWNAVLEAKRIGKERVAKDYGVDWSLMPTEEVDAFLDELRSLPTEYFEAKIDRAVGLGEFSGAVVPKGADKDVIDILRKNGITDIETYEKNDKEDRARAMRALAQRQGVLFQSGKKGAIEFLQDGRAIIHAFEAADISTLAHEIGHLFRRDLSSADLATAEKWAGAVDGKWTREAEEKFARGFERYLQRGKAPSEALRGIFEKFKTWLSAIYTKIKGSQIDVNISPAMGKVYDRLLSPTIPQEQTDGTGPAEEAPAPQPDGQPQQAQGSETVAAPDAEASQPEEVTQEDERYISEEDKAFGEAMKSATPFDAGEGATFFSLPGKEAEVKKLAERASRIKGAEPAPKPEGPGPLRFPAGSPSKKVTRAKTMADAIASVYVAASYEDSRYSKNAVLVDASGKKTNIVATDGRRMWMLTVPSSSAPKPGVYRASNNSKIGRGVLESIAGPEEGEFPPYQSVIDSAPATPGKPTATINATSAANAMRRAAIMTDEESSGVLVVLNPDGTLGFAARHPVLGTTQINVRNGYKELGAVSPTYFAEALDFAVKNGSETVSLWWEQRNMPLSMKGSEGNTLTITMPIKTDAMVDGVTGNPKPSPSSSDASPGTAFRNTPTINDRAAAALMDWSGRARKRFDDYMGKVQRGEILGSGAPITPLIDLAAHVAFKALASGITSKSGRKLTAFIEGRMADIRAKWPDLNVTTATLRRQVRNMLAAANDDREKIIPAYAAARERVERQRTRATGKESGKPAEVREAVASAAAERPDVAAKIIYAVKRGLKQGRAEGLRTASDALKPLIRQARDAAKRARQVATIEARGAADKATNAAADQAATEKGIRAEAVRLVQETPIAGRRKYLKSVANAENMRDLAKILRRLRGDLAKETGRHFALRAERLADGFKKLDENRLNAARKLLREVRQMYAELKDKDTGVDQREELASSIQDSFETLNTIIHEQRHADKVFREGRAIQLSEHREQMMDAIKKQAELPKPENSKEDREPTWFRQKIRKYADFRTLMQILDRVYDETGIFSRARRAMEARRTAELAKNQEFIDKAEKIVQANGYKSWSDFMARTEGAMGDAGTERIKIDLGAVDSLTVGQAMALYAQDIETKELMHGGQPWRLNKNGDSFVVDDYKLSELESKLTDGQKRIARQINQLRSDMQFDRADGVYKRITGNHMVKVEGHYPRKRILDKSGSEDTIDIAKLSMGEWAVQSLENSGFTIKRVQDRKTPLLLEDFGSTQVRSFQGTEMMIQRAEMVKYLKATMFQRDISDAIAQRYGGAMMKRLAQVVAEYSGNSAPESDQWIRKVAAGTARSMTQVNPGTWLRNLSTVYRLPLAMLDGKMLGAGAVAAALPKALANWRGTLKILMQHSPDLRHRWSHAGAAISMMPTGATTDVDSHFVDATKATVRQVLYAAKAWSKPRNAAGRLGEVSKGWNQLLDAIKVGNAFDAFAAVVAYHAMRAKAPAGLSPNAGDKWAARKAADAFMQTANTNDLLNANEWQTDAKRNTGAALILTFTSDIAKMQNLLFLANKRGGKARALAAGAVAASMVWSVAVRYALASLLGDDDEKKDQEAINTVREELVSLLPGGTNLWNPLLDTMTRGGRTRLSVLDTPLTSIVRHGEALVNEIRKEDGDPLEVAYRASRVFLDPVGNPLAPISGMVRRAVKNYAE